MELDDHFKEVRDQIRNDHFKSVENYKTYHEAVVRVQQSVFQLKLALGSLIVASFLVAFSTPDHTYHFSPEFKFGFLALLVSVISLLGSEFWVSMNGVFENYARSQKDTLLTNIRTHAWVAKSDKNYKRFKELGLEAEKAYNSDVGILSDMTEGLTLEAMLKKRIKKYDWKSGLLIWLALALCVPLLFCSQVLNG